MPQTGSANHMEKLTPLKRFLSTPCERELSLSINKEKNVVTPCNTNLSNESENCKGEASPYHNVKVVRGKGVRRRSNPNSLAGNLNLIKGQWSQEEDNMLVKLVMQHGVKKFSRIAKELVGRIGKQCRERWHNHLRPDIKKESWTEEEEKLLVEVHEKLGNRWAELARRIPGRSENSIKNHWNATKRKLNLKRKNKRKANNGSRSHPTILQEYITKTLTTLVDKSPKQSSHLPTPDYPNYPSNTLSFAAMTCIDNQNLNANFQEELYYNDQVGIEEPYMDEDSLDYLSYLYSPQQPEILYGESFINRSDYINGSNQHICWDSYISCLLNGGPSPCFEPYQEREKYNVVEEKDHDNSFSSNRDMDLIEMHSSSQSSNSNSMRSSSNRSFS